MIQEEKKIRKVRKALTVIKDFIIDADAANENIQEMDKFYNVNNISPN